ncbi:MAG TPA: hypothetical protein PKY88_00485 [Anaerohalosphaeraceae bacterium]|nr:hypothetical protein [Anaerohalosphaeraceae bacterium]
MAAKNDLQKSVEDIVLLQKEISLLENQINQWKELLKRKKAELHEALQKRDAEQITFPNGLYVQCVLKSVYKRQADLADDDLFGWLQKNNLGDIIKPFVPWARLNASLRDFAGRGGRVDPSIIQISQEKTVAIQNLRRYLATVDIQKDIPLLVNSILKKTGQNTVQSFRGPDCPECGAALTPCGQCGNLLCTACEETCDCTFYNSTP